MTQKQDSRFEIYHDLEGQLSRQKAQAENSARTIFKLLFEYAQPRSLLDVGCGLGGWLKVARELGIDDIRGIEGSWLDRSKLLIEPALVETLDLESDFSLQRRFDLVISLEVAEHLSAASADRFVKSLAGHGDLVLFSAAIPHQEGHHHLNEQYPQYWVDQFSKHQFRHLDFIRPRIWNDDNVSIWFRQNILLFAHERALADNAKLRGELDQIRPLNLVHPRFHEARIEAYQKSNELMQYLAQGGIFEVTPRPEGKMFITKR